MKTQRITQNNFCMGELSPRTYGRNDQPWYAAGCRALENFIVLPQGPAVARPGTIRECELSDTTKQWRVESIVTKEKAKILFLISEVQVDFFLVNDSDGNITVSRLTDANGNIAQCAVDYEGLILSDIQILQYNSQIYLIHPERQTAIITIEASTGTAFLFYFSPYYNTYDAAIKDRYVENDVVEYEGSQFICTDAAPSDAPKAIGDYYSKETYITQLKYSGQDIEPWDSGGSYASEGKMCTKDGFIWVVGKAEYYSYSRKYISGIYDGQKIEYSNEIQWYAYYSGTIPTEIIDGSTTRMLPLEDEFGRYYPYTKTPDFDEVTNDSLIYVNVQDLDEERPPSPGTGFEWLRVAAAPAETISYYDANSTVGYQVGDYVYYLGYVYICSITTGANPAAPGESAADSWDYVGIAPSFTSEGEYPATMIFHDGRLWIFGTKNNPNVAFASRISDYTNFTMGAKDSDAMQINLQINGSRQVNWATSMDGILIGTDKNEILISGNGNALTPSNFQAFPKSRSGSMRNGVANIGAATCFFQPGGYRILQFVFSNDIQSYQTPDLGVLGEHLLAAGVVSYSLQTNPDFILWCVMQDGTLLGGTFLGDAQGFGWHPHSTDGEFESIEVMRGELEDIIFVTVKRPISWDGDGNPTAYTRQLERFAPRRQDYDEKMVFMDDAEILTVTDLRATVSEEKRGMELICLHGGASHPNVTADENTGEITLKYDIDLDEFNTCVVGRAYYPRLIPQRIIPGGTELDTRIRISRAAIRFLNSLGVYAGIADEDSENLDPIVFRETTGVLGVPTPPYTGERSITINHSNGDPGWICIKRILPFPVTVLAVTYDLEIGGI